MSDKGANWYKHDPVRFLHGVQGLGPDLIGAYIVLLDLMYSRDGPVPRDDRHLGGILGCSIRKARALTDALIEAKKLTFEDGFIANSAAFRVIKERRNQHETNVKHGRKGGEISAANRKNNDLEEPPLKHLREEKSRVDSITPISPPQKADDEQPKKPARKPYTDEFEAWWSLYPRKTGKGAAFRSFKRKKKEFGADAVFEGLRAQLPNLAQQHRNGQDFRPHPATWLNQDRFNDPKPERKKSILEKLGDKANGPEQIHGESEDDNQNFGGFLAPVRGAASTRH